ncbi:MAG: glycosyltransferase family 2 protein [candidate division KSB1 bacterium]|nr:glycosyltransferase family 2 protein [candidate division KSB1 bacterium]
MGNKANISVVILNWNRKAMLLDCLRSIKELEYPTYEIIVVDNASTDGSVQAVREAYPDVVLIENDKNYGAIGGKNIGLRRALQSDADYIYMQDNDIVAAKDALTKLVEVAESDPMVGLVGAMMYDYSKPDTILSAGGIIDWTQNVSRGRGDSQKDVGQFNRIEPVDYLWGGALLARKTVLEKVGLFDEDYIGYWFEDTDLSVRVAKAGFKVLFNPFAKVWHKPHATAEQFSYRKKYLAARNAIRFMKKHATPIQWAKYLAFSLGGLPYMYLRDVLFGKNLGGARGKARGIWDGIWNNDKKVEQILKSNFKNPKTQDSDSK